MATAASSGFATGHALALRSFHGRGRGGQGAKPSARRHSQVAQVPLLLSEGDAIAYGRSARFHHQGKDV